MTGDPEFNEVFFDDVRVPITNVLGEVGGGWRLAMDTLGEERGGYALRRQMENQITFADLVISLREFMSRTGWIPDHRTAGAIGRLAVELRALEAQSRKTIDRLESGDVPSAMDSVDKLTLTRTEQLLFAVASELLGDARMVASATPRGLHAERWMRGLLYARSASVYGGTSEIQRTIVAERLLRLPRGR
jgi:alkylation response protein AidB-like acyl-CoA dehydrogenase